MVPSLKGAKHHDEGDKVRFRFGLITLSPIFLPIAACTLTGCQPGVLNAQGSVGKSEGTILIDSLAIMLAIVVPTVIATFGFAWWFRASNRRARHLPDWKYSGRLELLVWSIPLLTIMLLGGVVWIGSHRLDPARPLASKVPALDVQVVSLDWKWLFIYPVQHIASVNRLVVPAGVPIHFYLTSASVMNAFFVPRLGSMIYTMNGMVTQLYLRADAPGRFIGLSSHFSGDGFAGMHFDVSAVPKGRFSAWVDEARAQGPILDNARYRTLLQQSKDNTPEIFRSVAPDLFKDIVSQKLPPGPGPRNRGPRPTTPPSPEG